MNAAAVIRPLVLSGPSGAGKSTLLRRLMADFPETFGFSVSHTTRPPRGGEVHGRDYTFVTRPEFEGLVQGGEFIESAEFSQNLYGTSFEAVRRVQESGKICILDIDLQGVRSVKGNPRMAARFVLVRPPSFEALRLRLEGRATESRESLELRLRTAEAELAFADENPHFYDLEIVNDDVETAYQRLCDFIHPW